MRGRKPSCSACCVIEKTPEMTACEAMMIVAGGREHDEWNQQLRRCQQVERVLGGLWVRQQQRTLAKVVERERRPDQRVPDQADRRAPEMTEIGVQRLAARHRQEDRRQHRQAEHMMPHQERDAVRRIDRGKHLRVGEDLYGAERTDHDEPDEHDGTEQPADAAGAAPLRPEQHDQYHDGQRHDRAC